jgi:hypothetical protein
MRRALSIRRAFPILTRTFLHFAEVVGGVQVVALLTGSADLLVVFYACGASSSNTVVTATDVLNTRLLVTSEVKCIVALLTRRSVVGCALDRRGRCPVGAGTDVSKTSSLRRCIVNVEKVVALTAQFLVVCLAVSLFSRRSVYTLALISQARFPELVESGITRSTRRFTVLISTTCLWSRSRFRMCIPSQRRWCRPFCIRHPYTQAEWWLS